MIYTCTIWGPLDPYAEAHPSCVPADVWDPRLPETPQCPCQCETCATVTARRAALKTRRRRARVGRR